MTGAVILAERNSKGFDFAKRIYDLVAKNDGRKFSLTLADIERTGFKDGEYKLRVTHNIRQKHCFFVHDGSKEPSLWVSDLLFTLQAMRSSSPREINVVFPYFRFARQDRKDASRVGVSAKAVADVVSMYADRGMTVDLHAPQIQEYFKVPFDNLESFPVLAQHLHLRHPSFLKDLVVVSPDPGGAKRAEHLQKRFGKMGVQTDLAICYKRRSKDNEIGEIKLMGDVKEKNCLIVDDIIDTGETFVQACSVLHNSGARKVMGYGTHGLFSDGDEKFGCFEKIFVSDSFFREIKSENIERISLVELFGEAIYRTYVGESLSVLFD